MLTRIRDSSKSLAFYVLGGLVVAMLIISFGTPPVGGGADPGFSTRTALEVLGHEVSMEDYRQAFLLAQGNRFPTEQARAFRIRESVMDRLIERELLVAEAARLGFAFDTAQVEEQIARSTLILFGREQSLTDLQEDGVFSYERFRRFLQFYGMNERAFMKLQERELSAARVRKILAQGVTVSPDELRARFEREGNQVNLEYVRFPIRKYEDEIELSAEEIAAYAAKNEEELKAQYEQRKFLYDKVPRERKLRLLIVHVSETATEDDKKAAQAEAERLAREARATRDFPRFVARVRAEQVALATAAARAQARRGKAAGKPYFRVELRRLGWRREGTSSLSPDLEKRVFEAEDGAWLGPEWGGGEGYQVVWVESTREGNLGFDDVKSDLADERARKDAARARARADAQKALADLEVLRAKDPAKTFEDLFPAPAEQPAVSPEGPRVEETGLFSRRGAVVEGIGLSAELAAAAFALTKEAPVAGPFEVAGNFVVVRLKERLQPDLASFEATRDDLLASTIESKGRQIVAEWVLARCKQAVSERRLSVNKDALVYEDDKPGNVPYEPCQPPSPFGL